MLMAFALLYSLLMFITFFNNDNSNSNSNRRRNIDYNSEFSKINSDKRQITEKFIQDKYAKEASITNQQNSNNNNNKNDNNNGNNNKNDNSNNSKDTQLKGNKLIENEKKHDQDKLDSGTRKKEKNSNYEYIKFNGYIAPQQQGRSRGMFEQFEKLHDHDLVQEYCTALGDMCVGYAHHDFVGYQFYGAGSFPLTENKGWNFYLKHKKYLTTNENEKEKEENANANDNSSDKKLNPLYLIGKGLKFEKAEESAQKKFKNNVITEGMSQTEIDKLMGNEPKQEEKKEKEQIPGQVETQAQEQEQQQKEEPKQENKDAGEGKRYISYAMNYGRINNQLYSFEAMIQYALLYNRTLVIPWPRHRNHVMGLECGMWDYDRLREIIDIIIEHELPENLQSYRTDTPKNCQFHKLVGKGINKEKVDKECEMVYLYEGDLGIFKFEKGEYDVLKYMIPAPYIRNAVEKFLLSTFGSINYRIGIHRRAMDEGGKDKKTGSPYVCRWISHGIHGDSRFQWLRNFIDKTVDNNKNDSIIVKQIYQHSCAMTFWDLQNILTFHKQPLIDYENKNKKEKFFIAHDHQNQNAINKMKVYGGVEQPSARNKEKYSSMEWTKSNEMHNFVKDKCKKYDYCPKQLELQSKEEILFDMWALYYSEFIVGTWASTLTRTVCHWKGFDNSIYNGNQCWLYWKWKETANGKKNDWFTFDGLNYTALYDDPHEPLGQGNVFRHYD